MLQYSNRNPETSTDERVIEYTYQNEGNNPLRRNRFRRVQIKVDNLTDFLEPNTKSVRISVHRDGEISDKQLASGRVVGIIVENVAKMKAVIFNFEKCVEVDDVETKIILFILIRHEHEIAVATCVIVVNRQTDMISMVGRELSTDDIWVDSLSDGGVHNTNITLDKGYLQIIDKRTND